MWEILVVVVFALFVYFSLFFKVQVSNKEKARLIDKASDATEAQEYIRQVFQEQKHSAVQMWFVENRVNAMVSHHQRNIANEKNKQVVEEFMK